MSKLKDKIQQRIQMQQGNIDAQRARMQSANVPKEIDLTPLMALTDTWTGSNFARSYDRPENDQERADRQAGLEQDLQKQEMGLIDDEIKLLSHLDRQKRSSRGSGAKTPNIKAKQWKSAMYGKRMSDAHRQFDEIFGSKDYDPTSFGTSLERSVVPGAFQSENVKKQAQAERNFVNATLREESGAAIADSEFKSAELQYFPRAGDTPDILEQKRINRERVIEGFKLAAGEDAWNQFSDNSQTSKKTTTAPQVKKPSQGSPDFDNMSEDDLQKYIGE